MKHEPHYRAVENLVYEWARAIDENRVEAIADLMRENGRYTVISRFNADRGLPLAIIDAHSAAQLRDRILLANAMACWTCALTSWWCARWRSTAA